MALSDVIKRLGGVASVAGQGLRIGIQYVLSNNLLLDAVARYMAEEENEASKYDTDKSTQALWRQRARSALVGLTKIVR